MDILRDQLDAVKRPSGADKQPQISALSLAHACVSDYEAKQQLEAEINTLEQQLEQASKLADMYREQCVQAEDELARIREENEVHRWVCAAFQKSFNDGGGALPKMVFLQALRTIVPRSIFHIAN